MTFSISASVLCSLLLSFGSRAHALTYTLAAGNDQWPADKRAAIVTAMDQAVATYNAYGFFDKRVAVAFNPRIAAAHANADGKIEFGELINTRIALHEISRTLGVANYWSWTIGGWWGAAAYARVQLYEGQNGLIGTDAEKFWPYGMNEDSDDVNEVAREHHVKIVAAMRWDMGLVTDSDGDGMPDDWESFHFGSLAQTADGDPDGDGVSNLLEYTTDSNPKCAGPISGQSYKLRAQFSGKFADVAEGSTEDAGDVIQWSASPSSSQKWIAHHLGDGWWKLENARSGKVLETAGLGTKDGDNVQQWAWLGNYGQQWRLADAGNGAWRICNRQSGKALDVYRADASDGANIVQWGDWNGSGQRWVLSPIPRSQPSR